MWKIKVSESRMRRNKIDILEDEIYQEVLERLLWDHSRAIDAKLKSDLNKEGFHHIYWATDNYSDKGDGFRFFDEIQISSITGQYGKVIQPRAAKSKAEQLQRTRDKAEVFTPTWVCNAQNNMIDAAWFGRTVVFNTEVTGLFGNPDWTPFKDKIIFPEGKTWQEYVSQNCLEIACGEAPYLVSRYDATTGEPFKELNMRVGILDRKLRIVGENTTSVEDWIRWAKCAVQSIYGFEWQGDNLLLAREAVLYSLNDYFIEFTRDVIGNESVLDIPILKTFAYIISWNIFQMDGLKYVLPNTCHEEEYTPAYQMSFFETEDNKPTTIKKKCQGCEKGEAHHHNGVYVKVADWDIDHEEPIEITEFHKLIKERKV